MVIAGAGGHGLEVYQTLLKQGVVPESIVFFDEDPEKKQNHFFGRSIITDWVELANFLLDDPSFCLGVGNPVFRERLANKFKEIGGNLIGIKGSFLESFYSDALLFDQMSYSFVGPNAKIGKGVLINTRANVHHDCEVGEFTEIGPGAMLLGGVKVGKMCRIGGGAILLPGVRIGDEVTVGAGAVVSRDHLTTGVIKGIPAR